MALYRVLRALQVNKRTVPAGDFITSGEYPPQSLAKLEEVGAISLLHAPPLSELPCDYAEQLATIGIINADQLLEEPIDEISSRLNIDTSTARQWRAEVSDWLIIPVRPPSG